MLQIVTRLYKKAVHGPLVWLIAALSGLALVLWFPPFNHEYHPVMALFPLGVFVGIVPLLGFSIISNARRALALSAVFGFCASLAQYFWIGFVTAEGLWILILAGTLLICLVFTVYYVFLGLLFRLGYRYLGSAVGLLFPAVWVIAEWARTKSDLSFPWLFLGYAMTPLGPLAQGAALWGVYGFSFLIVTVNVALVLLIKQRRNPKALRLHQTVLGCAALICIITAFWGWQRLRTAPLAQPAMRVACVQGNIDQLNWGNESLDESFAVAESLVYQAAGQGAQSIILSESALLCYLERNHRYAKRVLEWSDSVKVPLIIGALHWQRDSGATAYEYNVHNTAFRIAPDEPRWQRYYKMKLVPFSEALPFEAALPLISRINLGEADFLAGTEQVLFDIGNGVMGVPLICYEVIYPSFVTSFVNRGGDVLVNITNDGWFGRTIGPYHHLTMARMRTIENGVSMIRCANSGISAIIDQYGRIAVQTPLYTRTLLMADIPTKRVATLIGRAGHWPLWVSAVLALCFAVAIAYRRIRRGVL